MIPLNKKMRLSHLWYLFEVVEDAVQDVHSPSPLLQLQQLFSSRGFKSRRGSSFFIY